MNPHLQFAIDTFGVQPQDPPPPLSAQLDAPVPGTILAVIGPSGAGKTTALDALAARTPGSQKIRPLSPLELELPVLSLFDANQASAQVLRCLARVGLADANLWTRSASSLSAGELRRLEIARALLCAGDGLLVLDEFDAHLDETTAKVLAMTLRRLGRSLAVSTHRRSLLPWLAPVTVIEINDGVATSIKPPRAKSVDALLDEIVIRRGCAGDYAKFAQWHYLGRGRPGPCTDVFIAEHDGRPIGIAIFGYPHMLLGLRKQVLPPHCWPEFVCRGGAAELNRDVRMLSRVVVEPRFRGVGVARALVEAGLASLHTPWVECLAQMGEFSDFLTRAGFRRIGSCPTPPPLQRLRKFMDEQGVATAELIDTGRRHALLERLNSAGRERLHKLLNASMRQRVETGHGALRGQIPAPFENPELLRGLLLRLNARPTYFLYERA